MNRHTIWIVSGALVTTLVVTILSDWLLGESVYYSDPLKELRLHIIGVVAHAILLLGLLIRSRMLTVPTMLGAAVYTIYFASFAAEKLDASGLIIVLSIVCLWVQYKAVISVFQLHEMKALSQRASNIDTEKNSNTIN